MFIVTDMELIKSKIALAVQSEVESVATCIRWLKLQSERYYT